MFSFSYTIALGDIDLQYSHTFINKISCLHLPTFRSQATIVSEKFVFRTACKGHAIIARDCRATSVRKPGELGPKSQLDRAIVV